MTLSQGGQLRPIRRYTHRAVHNGILSSVVITHPFPVSRPSTLPQLRFQALVISPNHRQNDMCGDRAVHLFSGYWPTVSRLIPSSRAIRRSNHPRSARLYIVVYRLTLRTFDMPSNPPFTRP